MWSSGSPSDASDLIRLRVNDIPCISNLFKLMMHWDSSRRNPSSSSEIKLRIEISWDLTAQGLPVTYLNGQWSANETILDSPLILHWPYPHTIRSPAIPRSRSVDLIRLNVTSIRSRESRNSQGSDNHETLKRWNPPRHATARSCQTVCYNLIIQAKAQDELK